MSDNKNALKNFLIVSRANIQTTSLPTAAIGITLSAENWRDLFNLPVLLFILLFFTILTYSCNINCLWDQDVDQKHKKHMSEAVKSLTSAFLKKIMALELIFAGLIILFLCILKKDIAYVLAFFGVLCGFFYSSPPLRIKKRGAFSPLPVFFGLYYIPIPAGGYLVSGKISLFLILFGMGYALIMQGITFINTCEDYDEDRSFNINTVAHTLGIRKTLFLGAIFTASGGLLDISLIVFFKIEFSKGNSIVLPVIILMCIFFLGMIIHISRSLFLISRAENPGVLSKKHATKMPLWFLTTRYPLLIISLLVI
jgi:4-hydroxybenzoate polyprenyltransferase